MEWNEIHRITLRDGIYLSRSDVNSQTAREKGGEGMNAVYFRLIIAVQFLSMSVLIKSNDLCDLVASLFYLLISGAFGYSAANKYDQYKAKEEEEKP